MKDTPEVSDVTIAICTYNRIQTLPRSLAALRALRGSHTFDVVVVNGPSTDGTTEFLAKPSDIRVFDTAERNLSVARNIALANAEGAYIAYMDDDAVPEPDWLSLALAAFRDRPRLAAVGGYIRDANGIEFQARHSFCDDLGRGYQGGSADYLDILKAQGIAAYPSLTGTNVVFDCSALREVGGFDEVFGYFLDETDVNKRLVDEGYELTVVPEAEIHHKYAASHLRTAENLSRDMFPIARSVAYFALRHGVPGQGWEAAIDRIKGFYTDEFRWKLHQRTDGQISQTAFETLMTQVRQGIRSGTDAYFDPVPVRARPQHRVARHRKKSTPVIHRMRPADDVVRLCMFSRDHAHAQIGGIGRWSRLVARGIAELGHEVTMIGELPEGAEQDYCDLTEDGYWSHNLSDMGRGAVIEGDCLGLPAALADAARRKLLELRRCQPRRDFQVLSAPIWDVEGAAAIGTGEIPTVLSLHTCAGMMLDSRPDWTNDPAFLQGHVFPTMAAERQALRRANYLLANSRAVLSGLSDLYGLDLSDRPHAIVPHGIDDIEAPEDLLAARQARRTQEDAPKRLLFVGRLEHRKGITHLVAALRALLQQGAAITADIVGTPVDDTLTAEARALAEAYPAQVRVHGYLDEAEVDGLMRQADIFVAPSTYESFGLIYVEAMRYYLPSVAFDTGGVGEVVSHGTDGFLAPLRDDAALVTCLRRLIDHPEVLTRMSLAARMSFEKKFGYRLMAERLVEVYGTVAGVEPGKGKEVHRHDHSARLAYSG